MVIRKVEDHVGKNFCCDANDVCEGQVTHFVSQNDGSNKLWYCKDHIGEKRERIIKDTMTPN